MSRIRNVKPQFFLHGELYDAEERSRMPIRLAYAGLWTVADRKGRFEWKPRELKLQILPYDPVDFEAVLEILVGGGWVVKYTVEGRPYGWLPTFERHQSINHRESESRLPAPPDELVKKYQNGSLPPAPPTRVPRVEDASTTGEARVDHACGTRPGGKGKEGKGFNPPLSPLSGDGGREGHRDGAQEGLRASTGIDGHDPGAEDLDRQAGELIVYLNEQADQRFNPADKDTVRPVRRLLRQGRKPGEVRAVIDHLVSEWKPRPEMRKYLRPSTIFKRGKFASYLGGLKRLVIDGQTLSRRDRNRHVFGLVGRRGQIVKLKPLDGLVLVRWTDTGVEKDERPENLTFTEPRAIELALEGAKA